MLRWVDRLGRNYQDVTDTVREFIRRGIRIETVIYRMVFDGTISDPMQQAIRDSLVAFMAATAQANAEVTKEAQKAGIAHAQATDDGTKYRGRKPTFTCEQFFRVRELLNQGIGLSAIAKTVGVKRQSVYRIRLDPETQLAALRAWYPEKFPQRFSEQTHVAHDNITSVLKTILPKRGDVSRQVSREQPVFTLHSIGFDDFLAIDMPP